MGLTRLIRPDGSTLTVDSSDAPVLKTLGYKEATPEQEYAQNAQSAEKEYFDRPFSKLATFTEGAASGMADTGLQNLQDTLDPYERDRAANNPGYRFAGELAGSLPYMALPGVGEAVEGAEAVSTGARLAKLGRGVVRGAGEGALWGAYGAEQNAKLAGEPMTAEAYFAGAGWGAIWGGGLTAAGHGLGALGTKLRGPKDPTAIADEAVRTLGVKEEAEFSRAKAEADIHTTINEGISNRDAALSVVEDAHYNDFRGAINDAHEVMKNSVQEIKDTFSPEAVRENLQYFKDQNAATYDWLVETGNIKDVRKAARGAQEAAMEGIAAGKAGNWDKMESSLEKYREHMGTINEGLNMPMVEGMEVPEFPGMSAVNYAEKALQYSSARFKAGEQAAEQAAHMAAVSSALENLPKTLKEFVGMTSGRAEKTAAALDHLMGIKSAELSGIQASVKDAINLFSERVGLTPEGSPGAVLREVMSAIKEARGTRATAAAERATRGSGLWEKVNRAQDKWERAKYEMPHETPGYSGGGFGSKGSSRGGVSRGIQYGAAYAASKAARRAGAGELGSIGAYEGTKYLTGAILGLKGAVLGKIKDTVAKWGPTAGRALSANAPRAAFLKYRLDGTLDESNKSKRELMVARAAEIRAAAPSVPDTLYKGVAGLSMQHPELAAAMHALGVTQFKYLLDQLPKDPGGAFNAFRTLWSPDEATALKFEKVYQVFHDPVGTIDDILHKGHATPEQAEALREMYPELYNNMRTELLFRISEPGVWHRMSYSDQVNIGLLLQLPVHSTMRPQFIASQQQMFQQRNDPSTIKPPPGSGMGSTPQGGRPPGPGATSAQRTTEH